MVCYRFGDFVLDADAFVLRRAGAPVALQPKALDVLRYLIEQRGRMVTKAELLDQLWRGEAVNEAVISWSVSHIRRALGQPRADKQPIETVHGRGYRFAAEVGTVVATAEGLEPVEPSLVALVGREQALAELLRCVQQAAGGHGRLCVITGDPGIGKTRCADELAGRARQLGIRSAVGRCPEVPGMPPLWPIHAALGQLQGERAARGRQLIAAMGEPDDAFGGDAPGARFRTIESLARVLREIAAAGPLLLILDDLHWADASTLQLLAFVAPELAELRLCIVATLRTYEREPRNPRDKLLLQVLRHAQLVPLGSLDAEQVGAMIELISRRRPSAALSEAVRRASGGVPLFVQEVVRSLLREHGADQLERLRPEAVRVPALARDVLRERIQQLPAATVALMARAAVIGESFELPLLAGLVELEPEALLDRLAPAVADGQLESAAPHVYRFAHALFQSVLFDDLMPGQRVAIHRKIAELLEARSDGAARRGEIARHYYFSLPAGAQEKVVRRAREAGEDALRVFAFEEAVLYLGWALEAQLSSGAADPRERGELLRSLALAQRSAGRTGHAIDTATRLIELGEQHGMHDLVVDATRLRRPTVALASMSDSLTRSALEQVLRKLPESATPVRISALSQLACVPPYDRDLARSKALSADAVALAERQADREVLLEALRARLFSLSGPDDIDELLRVSERMLEVESAGERSWRSMDARVARVSALLLAGRIADADAALSATEASLRSPHWGEATFYCRRMRAQRLFLDGRFDEAEESWRHVFADAARAGVSYAEFIRDAQELYLAHEREGPAGVIERRVRAMINAHRPPRWFRAGLARIAAQAGKLDIVRSELASLGDPGGYPRDGQYLHTLACFAVCAVALGDRLRCEQLAGLLAPYAGLNTPDALGYYLGSVSHFLGLLSAALGRSAQAREQLERALEHNRAMGYRAGAVRTQLALAEVEAQLGEKPRARAALHAACAEAQALGMRGAFAEASAALARS